VEEGSGRWAPPVGDSGTWDPLVGGRREGKGCWRGGKIWATVHLGQREEEGGEKVLGLRAENREGESFSFYFLFLFSFKNKPISYIFKTKFEFLFNL